MYAHVCGITLNSYCCLFDFMDVQLLPPTIRGVVLGLSARCFGIKKPDSGANPPLILCGALCIVFDTESIGFAGALARVFKRVRSVREHKKISCLCV